MPNVKIYVDKTLLPHSRAQLCDTLPTLRSALCAALKVDIAACQFAILTVLAMPDLPRVNVEIQILVHPGQTRKSLVLLADLVQSQVGSAAGTDAAVRIASLVPDSYIALK